MLHLHSSKGVAGLAQAYAITQYFKFRDCPQWIWFSVIAKHRHSIYPYAYPTQLGERARAP